MSQLSDLFAMTALPMLDSQHGEPVLHWPRGREADEVEIRAIVDRSNQTAEGAQIVGADGKSITAYLTVAIVKTVAITFNEKGTDVSILVIDGQRWYCEKPLGEDGSDDSWRHYQFKRSIGVSTARAPRA